MAALHLARATSRAEGPAAAEPARAGLLALAGRRFPGPADDVTSPTDQPGQSIIKALRRDLATDAAQQLGQRPPLADLLAAPLPGDPPVLFSFQRHDRRYPGLSVIRQPHGRFYRAPAEPTRIWTVPHLALSTSNLPGYLTNGNTPQGILAIVGEAVSKKQVIGPTPFLELRLPMEGAPADFYHDQALTTEPWTETLYAALLPDGPWRRWLPLREAYLAGQAGRWDIVAHGTTADPEPFRGEAHYPMVPTSGCLATLELWSPETGHPLASDQASLVAAWREAAAATQERGNLILLELDDQPRPVTINDAITEILAAEARTAEAEGP